MSSVAQMSDLSNSLTESTNSLEQAVSNHQWSEVGQHVANIVSTSTRLLVLIEGVDPTAAVAAAQQIDEAVDEMNAIRKRNAGLEGDDGLFDVTDELDEEKTKSEEIV